MTTRSRSAQVELLARISVPDGQRATAIGERHEDQHEGSHEAEDGADDEQGKHEVAPSRVDSPQTVATRRTAVG